MNKILNAMLAATLAGAAQASGPQLPSRQDEIPADPGVHAGQGCLPKGLIPPIGVDLHEDPFPAPDLDAPCLDEGFDSDHVALPAVSVAQEGRFQPMIQEGEVGFVPSPHFVGMARTLAIMNKLAYSRGQDYRNGHELTYQGTLAGWTIRNIKARRGFGANDPNAGFVAHNKALRTVAIIMHGSINRADWVTNFKINAVRLDEAHPLPRTRQEEKQNLPARTVRLPFVGYAHQGFLEKYLSCQEEIMAAVDDLLTAPDLTAEDKRDTKFYLSGHSQGAAVTQLLTLHLCQHLRKHYGPDFINAREHRVHAWLLASPTGLDETAVAFAEGWIGPANIVVQNTWLDIVPNVGYASNLLAFKALGTPVMQSTAEALQRGARAHRKAVKRHYANGDLKEAVQGAVLGGGLLGGILGMGNATIQSQHMATDDVNYRGVGSSFAFDPEMVDQSLRDLTRGLQMAYDQKQEKLRAASTPSTWQRFKGMFNKNG